MKLVVLLSCMHQNDRDIISRVNLQTDAVIINQCNEDSIDYVKFTNNKGVECTVKFISTTERGLSRSRNMAIENADDADICLICDDDEYLDADYENKIISSYLQNPNYPAILFIVRREDGRTKIYPDNEIDMSLIHILKSSSQQISFLRQTIISEHTKFDIMLGSGTGNGAGEENKFLLDISRNGHKIKFIPKEIGVVLPGKSMWFNGYNHKYMRNLGWSSRRSLGSFIAICFVLLFPIRHYSLIKKDISILSAYKELLIGYFEKRL